MEYSKISYNSQKYHKIVSYLKMIRVTYNENENKICGFNVD